MGLSASVLSELKTNIESLGLSADDKALQKFSMLYDLLIAKNEVMNLTAITDEREVAVKHFYDSLTLVKDQKIRNLLENGCRVCDLGTGAGFPGIPIKILFPNVKISFVDSVNKKLLYIDETLTALGLHDGCSICHSRAEDLGHDKASRETFDLVTSRAVANMTTLSEYCLPLVKPGGYFTAMKGGKAETESEITAAEKAVAFLGGKIIFTTGFDLPDQMGERTIVTIRKTKTTPKKYPRKAGLPSKEPLS